MSKRKDSSSLSSDLTLLGGDKTIYPDSPEETVLETFPNRYQNRDYWITFECPEFTSLCPVTEQPDFGSIVIRYIADARCVESKSLKLYLFSFRNHHAFHEEAVNRIMDDVIAACAPREISVEGEFRPRGGISINVSCYFCKDQ